MTQVPNDPATPIHDPDHQPNYATVEMPADTAKDDTASVASTVDQAAHKPLIPPSSERSVLVNTLLLLCLIAYGMFEGASFQRSGVFLPVSITGQMVFKLWIVLKMFMSAVGASMVCQGLLNLAMQHEFDRSRVYKKKRAGFLRVIAGSATLGVGMALGGSGPTMLPSQIGGGVSTAWVTLLGALAGGVVFSIIDKFAPSIFANPEGDEMMTLDTKVVNFRYELLSVPIGFVLVGVCVGLEFALPQSDDEKAIGLGPLPWYPTAAGAIVGVGQVPMRLIAGHGQGGSTSLMTVIGTLTCGVLAPAHRLVSFQQAWQFAFVWVGTTLGSLASSQINNFPYPEGVSYWRAAVGGFLMLFGARVAGGCTCGHGVSGFAELSLESAVAAICIFGFGIATGFVIEAAGGTMCCSA
uniref:Sulphur transport domain-containing protein n=1 Tax=Neobodo designis TaxID=312471 RepID=A0A7S1QFW4_NEODS|mmetsp:Transcript_41848/g.129327  ORF Transcript_41848/g.129327 Transcript_41848/m.129327 type:complete len:410 (+) Transcript_41848:70-1299(+)|eukprot:CAMPEP_0174850896 /NCGR_PEP_ID=MMETSP1114-20130205/21196_1 /TAXON_ID=312471 /ORGANISM="Neobodo designis, Strain CCAP 1951/1" /LENGTH=409 /DNA_ID=CAMNT_0016085387 /DNA_START=70 /DNA_END=1299 /DNA_ORIENTATION=-